MESHSTSPGWAGARSRVMVRRPTANESATVISTSTARPTPTGVARRSGCRSCGDCDQASGPTPPRRCPARGTGARHPSRAGARHSQPPECTDRPTYSPATPERLSRPASRANQLRDPDSANLSSWSCRSPGPPRQERTSAYLPIGVRSDPTPPLRPGSIFAPPAPGRLPADGPARFEQQPTVATEVERVPSGTESLTDLGKSNRLMLRVLVRHGAPAPCSRSERRCLGSRRRRLLDTRSVGREFVLA